MSKNGRVSALHISDYHGLTGIQYKRLQYFRATSFFRAESQPGQPQEKKAVLDNLLFKMIIGRHF